jgi:hypothetical protein
MDSVLNWVNVHPWLTVLGVIFLLILGVTIFIITRKPRLDRKWVEHLARMPDIRMTDDGFSVSPVIDWSYDAKGPVARTDTSFAACYADLKNIWFMAEPQPGAEYAAHTLVLFEFAGDRIVGMTVEARLEEGEEYSSFWGLFNTYELAYMWVTAKEALARRAVYLTHKVYVYPMAFVGEQKTGFLKALLEQTLALEAKARFYNTFTSNCTNELGKIARIPWHYSFVFTGYSPQYLQKLGYIPGPDFATVKQQAKLDAVIRSWNNLPDPEFDRALLAELRKRFGDAQAPEGG